MRMTVKTRWLKLIEGAAPQAQTSKPSSTPGDEQPSSLENRLTIMALALERQSLLLERMDHKLDTILKLISRG